ncbi:hypothetical protein V5F59_16365 [Xanthobacter autotrophicus DSM 431]|uniref:hypothetical protein n=1 Tax=Xanthobacter nonsaccharivorans TaxID=3119912 RepID=UPI003729F34F
MCRFVAWRLMGGIPSLPAIVEMAPRPAFASRTIFHMESPAAAALKKKSQSDITHNNGGARNECRRMPVLPYRQR